MNCCDVSLVERFRYSYVRHLFARNGRNDAAAVPVAYIPDGKI